jgi:hypothetical protein
MDLTKNKDILFFKISCIYNLIVIEKTGFIHLSRSERRTTNNEIKDEDRWVMGPSLSHMFMISAPDSVDIRQKLGSRNTITGSRL